MSRRLTFCVVDENSGLCDIRQIFMHNIGICGWDSSKYGDIYFTDSAIDTIPSLSDSTIQEMGGLAKGLVIPPGYTADEYIDATTDMIISKQDFECLLGIQKLCEQLEAQGVDVTVREEYDSVPNNYSIYDIRKDLYNKRT